MRGELTPSWRTQVLLDRHLVVLPEPRQPQGRALGLSEDEAYAGSDALAVRALWCVVCLLHHRQHQPAPGPCTDQRGAAADALDVGF